MNRIKASFIEAPRFTRVMLIGAWGLVASLAVLAAWLATDALATRDELPVLTRRLSNLEHEYKTVAVASKSLPTPAELQAMRSRVSRLNAVSLVRGWSSAEILSWLESHMNEDVHLVSFHHKAREPELLIVAEAQNAAVLTAFLSRLEREPGFSEVLLSKQSSRAENSAPTVQFEIKVRLKA